MIDLIHQSKNIFKKIFKSSLLAGFNQYCKFSLTSVPYAITSLDSC